MVSPSDARRGSEDEHGESSGGEKDRDRSRTALPLVNARELQVPLAHVPRPRPDQAVVHHLFRPLTPFAAKNVGEKDRDRSRTALPLVDARELQVLLAHVPRPRPDQAVVLVLL